MTFGSLVMGAFVSFFPIYWAFYLASLIAFMGVIVVFYINRGNKQ